MPTFTANDLATLKLGNTKEYSDGCYPCIEGSQGGGGQDVATNGANKVFWPNTNEFSWGGLGSSCSMNPFAYGYGYGSGGVCGQRATVKRTSYNGDKTNCCTSGNILDGENTCDPIYSDVSLGNCDSILAVYCSKPENVSNSKCQDFVSKRGASKLSPDAIQNYCAKDDNIISNFCQSQTKGAWTDNAVAAYCKKYPTNKSFCGCYNLDETYIAIQNQLEKKGISMFPHCNAKTCAANNLAYISSNVQPCPSQDICLQTIDIGSVGNTNSISGVNFNCTQTQIQEQQQKEIPTEIPKETGLSWSAFFLLIAIIFGVIIIIFFILKLLVGNSDQPR